MFYSHEILTKREYGVATVWLVATLGSKGTVRKVGRKDILSVNVPKACETVLQPRAPLALRLQSSLLYGIARVYGQQFEYLYHDVSTAHTHISRFQVQSASLDRIDLGKTPKAVRGNQLVLPDDPTIMPDFIPQFDLDVLEDINLNTWNLEDSVAASGTYTPSSQRSIGSQAIGRSSPGGYSSIGGSQMHSLGPYSDIHPSSPPARFQLYGEEDGLLQNHPGFEFDENGEMREVTPLLPDPGMEGEISGVVRQSSVARSMIGRLGSIDEEIPDFQIPGGDPHSPRGQDRDRLYQPPEDPDIIMEEAEPFPEQQNAAEAPNQEKPPPRRKKPRAIHVKVDEMTEFRPAVFKQNGVNYAQNMAKERETALQQQAKKYAQDASRRFVLENGIGGRIVNSELRELFSGAAIMRVAQASHVDNEPVVPDDPEETAGRGPDNASEFVDLDLGMGGFPGSDMAREVSIEAPGAIVEPELGRDTANEMPWNRSTSIAGSDHGFQTPIRQDFAGFLSSDAGTPFHDFGSAGQKITPSPRKRRGSRQPERMSILRTVEEAEEGLEHMEAIGGMDDLGDDLDIRLDEAEYFGAGAGLGTQGDTQAVDAAVEQQSFNFLSYLMTEIKKRAEDSDVEDDEDINFTTFEELIKPENDRRIVASQGFQHVLLLATKSLIYVSQEEPYGMIQLTLPEAA